MRSSGVMPPSPVVVEVPTWHLNCAPVLGSGYDQAIRSSSGSWAGP